LFAQPAIECLFSLRAQGTYYLVYLDPVALLIALLSRVAVGDPPSNFCGPAIAGAFQRVHSAGCYWLPVQSWSTRYIFFTYHRECFHKIHPQDTQMLLNAIRYWPLPNPGWTMILECLPSIIMHCNNPSP
jgi:hypothetical protein